MSKKILERHRGALLERLERLAQAQSIDFVVLFADDDRLYRRRGYEHASNDLKYLGINEGNSLGVLEGSFPDVLMVKGHGEGRSGPRAT